MFDRIRDRAKDALYGIRTTGTAACTKEGGVYYATTHYGAIKRHLDLLDLQPDDVMVDLGCGKGRVICMAARRKVSHVVGVDCMPGLVGAAQRNVMALRGRRSPVTVFCDWAERINYRSVSAVYLFNPFEAEILDRVLTRMLLDRKGPLRIMMVQESPEQDNVFAEHGLLRALSCQDGYGHPVSIYRRQ